MRSSSMLFVLEQVEAGEVGARSQAQLANARVGVEVGVVPAVNEGLMRMMFLALLPSLFLQLAALEE
jgi:hypothetical protein